MSSEDNDIMLAAGEFTEEETCTEENILRRKGLLAENVQNGHI